VERGQAACMTSARPTQAERGNPPVRALPRHIRSGTVALCSQDQPQPPKQPPPEQQAQQPQQPQQSQQPQQPSKQQQQDALAAAARKARAEKEKKNAAKPPVVWTNDNISQTPGQLSQIGPPPAAPKEGAAAGAQPPAKTEGLKEEKKEPVKDAAYWRAKFADARQGLQKAARARAARVLSFALILLGAAFACALLLGTLVYSVAYYHLPSIEALTDYRPKIPLRVWSADGVLLGEFGEERRSLVAIQDVPERLKQAILAAEDTNFYHHGGVDALGILRATLANLLSGHRAQGASTITMQVARNFFLSSERSYTRKVYEIALAVKIEASLSKDRILEVYVNQIYLGQRAYGFASAAQIYFGKSLSDLTLGECAMLAELPKAPSTGNPITLLPHSASRSSTKPANSVWCLERRISATTFPCPLAP
jgi:hypothetical protein